jgi:hypothetical protein
MLAVPAPPVIEPFVIDQAYVAPAPAFATDALLPVVLAQTVAGVVIVADGIGLMTTVVEACALKLHGPALVAVTMYVPATVMPVGFCWFEVKPPGPFHEYETASGQEAERFTEPPAHTGPLFDAVGGIVGGGGGHDTVVDAVPVIDAVTVSVAAIVCDPFDVNVTLKVCVPLSPLTKA